MVALCNRADHYIFMLWFVLSFVMSCMRVCGKQALSRVKYYYYATISKIQQATIMTV